MKLTDLDLSKPFNHSDMIGAFCIVDGKHWVHRDCIADFQDDKFIRTNCLGQFKTWGLFADDLLRDDWTNDDRF